jgi:hypothetical protein
MAIRPRPERELYLDLLKRCLIGAIDDPRKRPPLVSRETCARLIEEAAEKFKPFLEASGHTLGSFFWETQGLVMNADWLARFANGMHKDRTPDTMSDVSALDNIRTCVEDVLEREVEGDLIETGVWKGGLPAWMRGILMAHGVTDRIVWAADSFDGLPEADPQQHLEDAIWYSLSEPLERLRISLDEVKKTFDKYGLLDEQVAFLKGWFSETLPSAPIKKLALMRLDGDWYDSTLQSLTSLYPKLSLGGYVIIDDYGMPFGCRRAVDEFRERERISGPLQAVNHQAVMWQKTRPAKRPRAAKRATLPAAPRR